MGKKKGIFIELFNPSRSYLAGQIVQGRVVIQNESEEKVKEVTILLEGSSRVHWTEQQRYTVMTRTTVNGVTKSTPKTQTKTVAFYADEKYVSQKIALIGDGHNLTKLPAGYNAFPFQFVLPTNIPSSFTSRIGLVSYFLEVEMKRPFLKSNRRQAIPFTVNGIYDLNMEPAARQAQEKKVVKGSNIFACRKGQLGFYCKLPRRSGFVPGEILDFNCEVANTSNRKVSGLKATLYQNATYFAQGNKTFERKIIAQLKGPEVEVGECEMWLPNSLTIPPIPPTRLGGVCRLIDVQYALHLQLSITGLSTSMSAEFPVYIGTIPLRSTFDEIRRFPAGPSITAPVPPPEVPLQDRKSETMGFVQPQSHELSMPAVPSTSNQSEIIPSAPFLSEYPDLPPPTYAEAVACEGFSWNQNLTSSENSHEKMQIPDDHNDSFVGDRDPSAPPMYAEFVPNYVTYRIPGK